MFDSYIAKMKLLQHRYDMFNNEEKKLIRSLCYRYHNTKYYKRKAFYSQLNKYERLIIDDYCNGVLNIKDLNIKE